MRAQGRPGVRSGLQDGHLGDPSVFAIQINDYSVGSRLVQPVGRPSLEVAVRRLRDRSEEVVDRGVPVCMRLQIGAHTTTKCLRSYQVVKLGQGGRSLVVRDGVEVGESRVRVRSREFDGVRGVAFVRLVGAHRAQVGAEPSLRELGGLHQRKVRHEGGERFIQPQPVPPLHRDEVSEPHMRHLVQDHAGEPSSRLSGDRTAPQEALAERDGTDVFHRTRVEVRHDDLVVFAERIGDPKVILKEIKTLARWNKPMLRIDEVRDRCPREEPQGNLTGHRLPGLVVAGMQRIHVGADPIRWRERPGLTVAQVGNLRFGDDRDHLPIRRHGHAGRKRGFDVRLVQAREQAVRVVRFEVGVEIVPSVHRITETIQAAAVGAVGVRERDLHRIRPVPQRTRRQCHEIAVVRGITDSRAIDLEILDRTADKIDGQIRLGIVQFERGRGAPGVLLGFAIEFELQNVGHVPYAGGSSGGTFDPKHRRRLAGRRFRTGRHRDAGTSPGEPRNDNCNRATGKSAVARTPGGTACRSIH